MLRVVHGIHGLQLDLIQLPALGFLCELDEHLIVSCDLLDVPVASSVLWLIGHSFLILFDDHRLIIVDIFDQNVLARLFRCFPTEKVVLLCVAEAHDLSRAGEPHVLGNPCVLSLRPGCLEGIRLLRNRLKSSRHGVDRLSWRKDARRVVSNFE